MEKNYKRGGGPQPGAGRPALEGTRHTLTMRIPKVDLEAIRLLGFKNFSRFYIEAGQEKIKQLKKK